MDVKTGNNALSLHDPGENTRIYNLGGFVTPIAGASPQSFVAQWHSSLKIRNPRFYNGTGFGYGADMNGLAEQSQPTSGHPISYPFTSYDGRVRFDREQWGQRVFDLNHDGVANYGMYADWLQELQTLAGRPILNDMFHGAEAYVQMWERAYGVPAGSCRPGRGSFAAGGIGPCGWVARPRRCSTRPGSPRPAQAPPTGTAWAVRAGRWRRFSTVAAGWRWWPPRRPDIAPPGSLRVPACGPSAAGLAARSATCGWDGGCRAARALPTSCAGVGWRPWLSSPAQRRNAQRSPPMFAPPGCERRRRTRSWPVRGLSPPSTRPQHARLGVLALPALSQRARSLSALPAVARAALYGLRGGA